MIKTPIDVINFVNNNLHDLPGHIFDVISITKPDSVQEAIHLSKIISKLSPLVGNLIEFKTVDYLNSYDELKTIGRWKRQDPGFPDTIFESKIEPTPGFEIKAWFPLATEITARFKDSQKHFLKDQTYVLLIAWLPEFIIFGKPKIIDVCSISGKSIAEARDEHYHKPPDYLVIEPEDTSGRTSNLQQTNTNGYKFQGTENEFKKAEELIKKLKLKKTFDYTEEYQTLLHQLQEKFKYRLDTNYAKIDRIEHTEIEKFKLKVLSTKIYELSINDWAKIISSNDDDKLKSIFSEILGIHR